MSLVFYYCPIAASQLKTKYYYLWSAVNIRIYGRKFQQIENFRKMLRPVL